MKWLLILIFIAIIMLLLIPVEFNIFFLFDNGKSSIRVSITYLFGLLKTEIKPFDNKKKDKYKKVNEDIKQERKVKELKKITEYKELINYIIRKIRVKKFKWETKIGLSDSYYLSILYGFTWWFKSLIIGYFLSKKEIKDLNINLFPLYNTNEFSSQINCIINVRMVYIINIWIKLYEGGEKIDRSSYRRLNENYNE
ncbi:MAG: DUF2953 domain-containing protein [Tissierellia bacterium]|nr:DUF2953 domain-containing protein [Tissierellia bacterium]